MITLNNASQKQLRQYVEQIEQLQSEMKGIADDIKDKFTEAKGVGFDVKILRKVLALRKKSKAEREEEDAILTTYCYALGLRDTPLGTWADQQEGLAVV